MLVAAVHRAQGEIEKERAICEHIVEKYPLFSVGVKRLAEIYWQLRCPPEKTYQVAAKARDLLPGDPDVAAILGKVACLQGKHEWAELLLQEALRAFPNRPENLYYAGICRLKKGDKETARRYFSQALAASSEFPEASEAQHLLDQLE